MLRITVQQDPRSVTIKLEGKVAGSWVEESIGLAFFATFLGFEEIQFGLAWGEFRGFRGTRLMRRSIETGAAFLRIRL